MTSRYQANYAKLPITVVVELAHLPQERSEQHGETRTETASRPSTRRAA
jgi:hypothetical protein